MFQWCLRIVQSFFCDSLILCYLTEKLIQSMTWLFYFTVFAVSEATICFCSHRIKNLNNVTKKYGWNCWVLLFYDICAMLIELNWIELYIKFGFSNLKIILSDEPLFDFPNGFLIISNIVCGLHKNVWTAVLQTIYGWKQIHGVVCSWIQTKFILMLWLKLFINSFSILLQFKNGALNNDIKKTNIIYRMRCVLFHSIVVSETGFYILQTIRYLLGFFLYISPENPKVGTQMRLTFTYKTTKMYGINQYYVQHTTSNRKY